MIAFLKKRGISLSCVLFAGFSLLLTSCGGDGKGDNGYAPDTIVGKTLQLVPGTPTSGSDPGLVNLNQTTASIGIVNKGTQYPNSDVVYQKTGPNTASVAFALHVPEVISTPTTVTYAVSAELLFEAEGQGTSGTITHWKFSRFSEGSYAVTRGEGNSGTCWIMDL